MANPTDIERQINQLLQQRIQLLRAQNEQMVNQSQVHQRLRESMQEANENLEDQIGDAEDLGDALSDAADEAERLGDQGGITGGIIGGLSKGLGMIGSVGGAAFKVLTGAAGMLWSALKNVGSMISDLVVGLGKVAFSVITSVLSIPFKIYNWLMKTASQTGGGSEFATARQNIIKSFGGFGNEISDTVMGTYRTIARGMFRKGRSSGELLNEVREAFEGLSATAIPLINRLKSRDAQKAFMSMVKGFGMSKEAIKGLGSRLLSTGEKFEDYNRRVVALAKAVAGPGTGSFKMVGKQIMELAADFKTFGHLSEDTLSTVVGYFNSLGLEIKEVTGVMSAFSQFKGAAENVAALSQVFGMQVDTLTMIKSQDPATMFDHMRKAFLATGRSVKDLNRHELDLLASKTGLSKEAIKVGFSHKNQGKSLDEVRKMSKKGKNAQEKLADSMKRLVHQIERLIKSGSRAGGIFQNFIIGFEKGAKRAEPFRRVLRNIQRIFRLATRWGMKFGRMFVYTPKMRQFFDSLAGFFDPGRWNRAFSKLYEYFKVFLTNPSAGFPILIEGIKEFFKTIFPKEVRDALLSGFEAFATYGVEIVAGFADWLMSTFAKGIDLLVKFIEDPKNFFDNVANAIVPPANAAMDMGERIMAPLMAIFDLDNPNSGFSKLVNAIAGKPGAKGRKGGLIGVLVSTWGGISRAFMTEFGFIFEKKFWDEQLSKLKTMMGPILDDMIFWMTAAVVAQISMSLAGPLLGAAVQAAGAAGAAASAAFVAAIALPAAALAAIAVGGMALIANTMVRNAERRMEKTAADVKAFSDVRDNALEGKVQDEARKHQEHWQRMRDNMVGPMKEGYDKLIHGLQLYRASVEGAEGAGAVLARNKLKVEKELAAMKDKVWKTKTRQLSSGRWLATGGARALRMIGRTDRSAAEVEREFSRQAYYSRGRTEMNNAQFVQYRAIRAAMIAVRTAEGTDERVQKMREYNALLQNQNLGWMQEGRVLKGVFRSMTDLRESFTAYINKAGELEEIRNVMSAINDVIGDSNAAFENLATTGPQALAGMNLMLEKIPEGNDAMRNSFDFLHERIQRNTEDQKNAMLEITKEGGLAAMLAKAQSEGNWHHARIISGWIKEQLDLVKEFGDSTEMAMTEAADRMVGSAPRMAQAMLDSAETPAGLKAKIGVQIDMWKELFIEKQLASMGLDPGSSDYAAAESAARSAAESEWAARSAGSTGGATSAEVAKAQEILNTQNMTVIERARMALDTIKELEENAPNITALAEKFKQFTPESATTTGQGVKNLVTFIDHVIAVIVGGNSPVSGVTETGITNLTKAAQMGSAIQAITTGMKSLNELATTPRLLANLAALARAISRYQGKSYRLRRGITVKGLTGLGSAIGSGFRDLFSGLRTGMTGTGGEVAFESISDDFRGMVDAGKGVQESLGTFAAIGNLVPKITAGIESIKGLTTKINEQFTSEYLGLSSVTGGTTPGALELLSGRLADFVEIKEKIDAINQTLANVQFGQFDALMTEASDFFVNSPMKSLSFTRGPINFNVNMRVYIDAKKLSGALLSLRGGNIDIGTRAGWKGNTGNVPNRAISVTEWGNPT